MSAPTQGGNAPGQYYDWNNQGPDMSKYSAPSDPNQSPPPYGFSSPAQPQGAYPPQQQGAYPPQQQGAYPPQQQGTYPPQQQGVYPPPGAGLPLPVASSRARKVIRNVMCIRVTLAIVTLIIVIVGAVTGYYSYH